MSADWPEGEPSNVSLPTIVSSTDLFDGELFGDELIDIYNNEVTGENGDTNEIPSLLGDKSKSEDERLHPGAQMALTAAGMDDGLGAFRPSTSFNDLSSLLTDTATSSTTPSTTADGSTTNTLPPTGSSAPAAAATSSSVKKRSMPTAENTSSDLPPTKRQATDTKLPVQSVASEHSSTTTPPAAGSKKSEKHDSTPNPLSLPEPLPSVARDLAACAPESGADFKSIAQAAVSSLILNAGSTKAATVNKPSNGTAGIKVDTSTAHIKALTGNNWVSACAGATTGIVPVAPQTDAKNANRARRQNLTPDERARQNRDRNREHARNTRLRKKAYVEELKRTLTELVAQRDASDLERRQSTQREAEQREVRFRVIEEFLKLRGRNEPNFARWAAILEDGFHLTLPMTPFRSAVGPAANGDSFEQVLTGVPEVMADATNFSKFLQAFKGESDSRISFQYECNRKKFFMDGCDAALEWTAKSSSKASADQFYLKGIIRGHFSPASNKLIHASISFDTGVVSAQLGSKGQQANQEAAEAAASQAGAILDSLQVPQISVAVPSAVTVVPPSSSSSSEASSADKDDALSSDGSDSDRPKPSDGGVTTRRTLRRSS